MLTRNMDERAVFPLDPLFIPICTVGLETILIISECLSVGSSLLLSPSCPPYKERRERGGERGRKREIERDRQRQRELETERDGWEETENETIKSWGWEGWGQRRKAET